MRELLIKYRGKRSQATMALKYGVSQQAWSNWERGVDTPKLHTMAEIEKDSGFSMKEIFFDSFNKQQLLSDGDNLLESHQKGA